MTDRRRRAAASDSSSREDNPFAPPPEGQPDQPWQPRHPRPGTPAWAGPDRHHPGSDEHAGPDRHHPGSDEHAGPDRQAVPRPGDDSGDGSQSGSGSGSGSGEGGRGQDPWGGRWSRQQPGRQSGGFGGPSRPGGQGDGQEPQGPRGMRWDPTDPLQRHARYALHAGIWGLFFVLLGVPQAGLLLGALSVYWGISALRNKPPKSASGAGEGGKPGKGGKRGARATAEDVAGTSRAAGADEPGSTAAGAPKIPLAVTPEQAAKAKRTAAIGGLVTAGLTLALVAATFTFRSVYSEYYTCRDDALTQSSRADCKKHLPEDLRPFLENRAL